MTLAISVDLFIALFIPIWYRVRRTVPYILTMVIICSMYSLSILILGWMAVDDEAINFCNPPLVVEVGQGCFACVGCLPAIVESGLPQLFKDAFH
ncbi:hypothetical protein Y032_0363g3540 [Ancylostoma ceylanicum]|nr:hypothetical protein Y032_0363g3540 [Ancylostoma ceylanicum]